MAVTLTHGCIHASPWTLQAGWTFTSGRGLKLKDTTTTLCLTHRAAEQQPQPPVVTIDQLSLAAPPAAPLSGRIEQANRIRRGTRTVTATVVFAGTARGEMPSSSPLLMLLPWKPWKLPKLALGGRHFTSASHRRPSRHSPKKQKQQQLQQLQQLQRVLAQPRSTKCCLAAL